MAKVIEYNIFCIIVHNSSCYKVFSSTWLAKSKHSCHEVIGQLLRATLGINQQDTEVISLTGHIATNIANNYMSMELNFTMSKEWDESKAEARILAMVLWDHKG